MLFRSDVDKGLNACATAGLMPLEDAEKLVDTYKWLWALQIGARLVSDGAFDPEACGGGAVDFLLRLSGEAATEDLAAQMASRTDAAGAIIDRALGQESPE